MVATKAYYQDAGLGVKILVGLTTEAEPQEKCARTLESSQLDSSGISVKELAVGASQDQAWTTGGK